MVTTHLCTSNTRFREACCHNPQRVHKFSEEISASILRIFQGIGYPRLETASSYGNVVDYPPTRRHIQGDNSLWYMPHYLRTLNQIRKAFIIIFRLPLGCITSPTIEPRSSVLFYVASYYETVGVTNICSNSIYHDIALTILTVYLSLLGCNWLLKGQM